MRSIWNKLFSLVSFLTFQFHPLNGSSFCPNKSDQSIQQQTTHESGRWFLFVCISCVRFFAGKNSHSRKAGLEWNFNFPSWELSKWSPPKFETLQHLRQKSLDLFSLGWFFGGFYFYHGMKITISASKSRKIQGSDFGNDLTEKTASTLW